MMDGLLIFNLVKSLLEGNKNSFEKAKVQLDPIFSHLSQYDERFIIQNCNFLNSFLFYSRDINKLMSDMRAVMFSIIVNCSYPKPFWMKCSVFYHFVAWSFSSVWLVIRARFDRWQEVQYKWFIQNELNRQRHKKNSENRTNTKKKRWQNKLSGINEWMSEWMKTSKCISISKWMIVQLFWPHHNPKRGSTSFIHSFICMKTVKRWQCAKTLLPFQWQSAIISAHCKSYKRIYLLVLAEVRLFHRGAFLQVLKIIGSFYFMRLAFYDTHIITSADWMFTSTGYAMCSLNRRLLSPF